MRQFTCPKAVTHPSTNRARCRATALIETSALPLHQTANHALQDHGKSWIKRQHITRSLLLTKNKVVRIDPLRFLAGCRTS